MTNDKSFLAEPLPADFPRGPQLPDTDRWPALFFGGQSAKSARPAKKKEGTVRFLSKRVDLTPIIPGAAPDESSAPSSPARSNSRQLSLRSAVVSTGSSRAKPSPGRISLGNATAQPSGGTPPTFDPASLESRERLSVADSTEVALAEGNFTAAGAGPAINPLQIQALEPEQTLAPQPRVTPLNHADPAAITRPFRTARITPSMTVRGNSFAARRELWLGNGEKISGTIQSESDVALSMNHQILGHVAISKQRIAKRLAEIFLRNGDRLVGELINESPEAISMEHSGLGIITIPRSEVCSRVASFQLENGDRVCGEVIEETPNLIRLKSDSLGVITVPRAGIRAVLQKTY